MQLYIFECIEGHLNWRGLDLMLLNAIVYIWGYWGDLTLRKLDSRLFNPNCTHGRILRSFELNTSWYDVVECNCAYLRVLRAFKLKRVYFKWVEGTKAYYSYWGLNWSELRMAMHIRNKEGLIWMCIGTFDLKLTWFEWFEGAETIIIEEDVF